MSHTYRAVGWNPQKRSYDLVLAGAVAGTFAAVAGGTALVHPQATAETLLIRASAVTAVTLLHVILCIGPLCRLDARFLPLLYNRRHLGVTMFTLALAHGGTSIFQFHALGDASPLVSLLTTSTGWTDPSRFPFQVVGLGALGILFLMAATSHDFWLRTLTAPVWKALHMGVYVAYGLVLVHVAFGALQAETHPALALLLVSGAFVVLGLHVAAAAREARVDAPPPTTARGLVDAGPLAAIPMNRAVVRCVAGERVAIFRHAGGVSAISNVCQHQNGPLGEGRVINGCVVCPWHGYEYDVETGASPPPFTEAVPTFRVTVEGGRVLVDPRPLPPGTRVTPART